MAKKRRRVAKKDVVSKKSVVASRSKSKKKSPLKKEESKTVAKSCYSATNGFMVLVLIVGILWLLRGLSNYELVPKVPYLPILLIVLSLGYLVWKKK